MKKYLSLLFLAIAGVSPLAFAQAPGVQVAAPTGLPTPDHMMVTLNPSTLVPGGVTQLTAIAVMSDSTQNQNPQTPLCTFTSSDLTRLTIQAGPNFPGQYQATAPLTAAAGTVIVTCTTSWATGTVSGSATATIASAPIITNPSCAVQPCILTPGTQSQAYPGFTFTQAGATAPIVWAVSVGSLPAGMNLNASTGALSGTPAGSGTSLFSVTVSGANGTSSPQQESLTINGSSCTPGPPGYLCTPSNIIAPQPISAIPFSGQGSTSTGLDGTFVAAPEPGNAYGLFGALASWTRISNDSSFCGAPTEPTCVYNLGSYLHDSGTADLDGSADSSHFSSDETQFFFADTNSGEFNWFYSLNPGTGAVGFLYSNFSTGGQALWGSKRPGFAHAHPKRIYGFANSDNSLAYGTYLWSWDTSVTYPTLPPGTNIVDVSVGGLLFDGTTYPHVNDSPAIDATDSYFAEAFSNSKDSHTARVAVWYTTTCGIAPCVRYAAWNTSTGVYTKCTYTGLPLHPINCSSPGLVQCQNCGVGVTNPGTFPIHNIRMDRVGAFVNVAIQNCDAGSTCYTSSNPYLFDPLTGNVWAVCGGATPVLCGGHWASGYHTFFNNFQRGDAAARIMTSGLTSPTKFPLANICPYPTQIQDEHLSVENMDALDSHYVLSSTSSDSVNPDYTQCFTNSLLLRAPPASAAAGTVKIVGHTYVVPTACFGPQIGLSIISPLGNFLLVTSDMGAQLGCADGSTSCTVSSAGTCSGKAPRGDVFLVNLKQS